jgi:hypothetical protein
VGGETDRLVTTTATSTNVSPAAVGTPSVTASTNTVTMEKVVSSGLGVYQVRFVNQVGTNVTVELNHSGEVFTLQNKKEMTVSADPANRVMVVQIRKGDQSFFGEVKFRTDVRYYNVPINP